MASKYTCVACRKEVTGTKNDRYRSHSGGDGEPCEMSSGPIPEHVLAQPTVRDDAPDVPREGVDFAVCPQCERKVKLTRMGYFEPHQTTLRGGERCPVGGVRAKHARRQDVVPLPGDEKPKPGAEIPAVSAQREIISPAPTSGPVPAADIPKELLPSGGAPTEPSSTPAPSVESGASTDSSSPASETTWAPSQEWTDSLDWFFLETAHAMLVTAAGFEEASAAAATPESAAPPPDPGFDDVLFAKAPSRFPPRSDKPMRKMTEREQEIAGRIKEIFYAYTNRNSSDNRSAQKTLGPSEAGSPCDRQLAMKLLGIEPVNPQESWAPFVGTAVHEELARMFEWANGSGSGRFVTEMPVSFGSVHVPRGTLDLLDRVLFMVDDHKLMGRYSLEQLRREGPSETYRKQIQIYGLGAELAGEVVREVAIIAWPRQESTLNKLFVHVEPYDRRVAEEALDRVARIAREVEAKTGPGTPRQPIRVAQSFPVAEDCKWCPFHLEGDKEMTRGCSGK